LFVGASLYFVKAQFTSGFGFFVTIVIKIKSFNNIIKRLIQDLGLKEGTPEIESTLCTLTCKASDHTTGYPALNTMPHSITVYSFLFLDE